VRTWTRAIGDTICGGHAQHEIRLGDPMQVIALPDVKRVGVRCCLCADGEPPPDLPARVETSIPIQATSLVHGRVGNIALPMDFKMAAAGREPGCDDD
jgi:hypothetical protein